MGGIELGILFIFGIGILGGLFGGWFFRKIHIPQVVGYIIIGLIVGQSGLKLVEHADIVALRPFNMFALGIIGFLVGGELKMENFRKYGRQFLAILLGEGIGAFVIVGTGVGLLTFAVTRNVTIATATGVIFGAIASATDPASTIDVLWENRALGVLTTSLTAIVALDDALAMALYGLGTGLAQILTHSEAGGSVWLGLGKVSIELGGGIVLGIIFGFILMRILRYIHQPERGLAFALGMILLLISIAMYLDFDVILTAMTLGFILINIAPHKSEELFKVMRGFSIPIYVLFFVLVGARLGITSMPPWLWGIVAVYVIGRTAGKMAGAYAGAKVTGSDKNVRNYLGMGLLAQGGVAIGLSIVAGQHLGDIRVDANLSLGEAITFGVAATTLIVQLVGPPMVKLAVKLSGDIGRNVTREDIIDSWKVRDVVDTEMVTIPHNQTLHEALRTISRHDYSVFPVSDAENRIVGVIPVADLKHILMDQDSWRWLLTADIMTPIEHETRTDSPLWDVLRFMQDHKLEQLPVFRPDGQPAGMVDLGRMNSKIEREILRRREN